MCVPFVDLCSVLPADMLSGGVGNMEELGVMESYKVKCHVLLYSAEAAEMILRVDDILKSAPIKVWMCMGCAGSAGWDGCDGCAGYASCASSAGCEL